MCGTHRDSASSAANRPSPGDWAQQATGEYCFGLTQTKGTAKDQHQMRFQAQRTGLAVPAQAGSGAVVYQVVPDGKANKACQVADVQPVHDLGAMGFHRLDR